MLTQTLYILRLLLTTRCLKYSVYWEYIYTDPVMCEDDGTPYECEQKCNKYFSTFLEAYIHYLSHDGWYIGIHYKDGEIYVSPGAGQHPDPVIELIWNS